MNDVAVIAAVRKTVRVKAPIAHAFEVFTSGLTRWWPHDHGVGHAFAALPGERKDVGEQRADFAFHVIAQRHQFSNTSLKMPPHLAQPVR